MQTYCCPTHCQNLTKTKKSHSKRTRKILLQDLSLQKRSKGLVSKNVQGLPLVDLILMEESSRTKCSKVGESYCYKTLQTYLNINDGVFGTWINETLILIQQKRTLRATR